MYRSDARPASFAIRPDIHCGTHVLHEEPPLFQNMIYSQSQSPPHPASQFDGALCRKGPSRLYELHQNQMDASPLRLIEEVFPSSLRQRCLAQPHAKSGRQGSLRSAGVK